MNVFQFLTDIDVAIHDGNGCLTSTRHDFVNRFAIALENT
jgi:hypothetical protein